MKRKRDNFDSSEKAIAAEKQKARDLRNSQWWKNRIAEGKCHYCRKEFHPSELTMDHVVPLSRGGKSRRSNVVASCKECNSRKKYFTPFDMAVQEIEDSDQ